jgi:Fe-S cluster biosynthesis and repair protein YggX
MSQLQDRIAQFRKMAADDPDNELGHYRLGQLLMEAGQHEDAIASFRRTLELSPTFSRVYEYLGSCLLKLNRRDEAVKTLSEGWKVADERGDRMPREAIAKMLTDLGESIPTSQRQVEDDGGGTGFRCQRPTCTAGSRARQLASPPVPDEIGKRIYESICADCWNDWIRNYSIKVINELRIDLSTEYGQDEYDKYMRGFFGFDEEPAPGSGRH